MNSVSCGRFGVQCAIETGKSAEQMSNSSTNIATIEDAIDDQQNTSQQIRGRRAKFPAVSISQPLQHQNLTTTH
jgi:hypothetical protein